VKVRPPPGALVLGGIAAFIVVLVIAAYHGSGRVAPSDCAKTSTLLHRTQADLTGVRASFAAGGTVPGGGAAALAADNRQLAEILQREQSADMAFDERAIPVLDGLTRLASDSRGDVGAKEQVAADLSGLDASLTGLLRFCG
jgi:hypothetical protein